MSGRDFKSFLASHQYQMGRNDTRLVNRFLSGSSAGTYKDIDYDKLLALTKLKRSAGSKTLKKLEKLNKTSLQTKESHLLSEHRAVWQKEFLRLKNLQRALEEDGDSFLSSCLSKDLPQAFEIASCKESLRDSFDTFVSSTIQPLYDLRDDLVYWMQENREKLILNMAQDDHEQVMGVVQSVKSQQRDIMDKLDNEEELIDEEISQCMSCLGIEYVDFKIPMIETGIPDEASNLFCSNENFKSSSLGEFRVLDQRYAVELQKLEEHYKETIERYPEGGWSSDDHLCFKHILEQYSSVEKVTRRKLYLDRMGRELRHFTRKELVDHESWWFNYKSFGNQLKDLISAWLRDREDLLIKIGSIFHEYNLKYEEKLEKILDKRKQEAICEQLHKKLEEHQQQKMEVMKLEAAHKALEEQSLEESRDAQERREADRRLKMKKKIALYQEDKQKKLEQQQHENRERLKSLKEHLQKQKERDMERTNFRREEHERKLEVQRSAKEALEQEEIEKEQRLERLRAQVRVEAPVDPLRVLDPTEASLAHAAARYDEEKDLHEPLFHLHTYNVQQISNDKRLRMEQALRAVGLHNSSYARHILSTLAPPTQPRRDQKSTVFRSER